MSSCSVHPRVCHLFDRKAESGASTTVQELTSARNASHTSELAYHRYIELDQLDVRMVRELGGGSNQVDRIGELGAARLVDTVAVNPHLHPSDTAFLQHSVILEQTKLRGLVPSASHRFRIA